MRFIQTKNILPFLLVVLLVLAGSCTKDFEEMNVGPIGLTEDRIDEDILFTRAQLYGALRYSEFQRAQMLYTQHYIQWYAVSVPYFETDRYITRNDWATAYWEAAYADFGMQIQQVINLTAEDPAKANKNAIARIWKVFIMHRITDFWGDVPYSEAWTGDLTPAYDTQESIYRDMLEELETAVLQFNPSLSQNFGSNDLIYQGNINSWKKFANSLRLRLALRISGVAPELAKEHGEAVLAENNFISSIEESAIIKYGRDYGSADENVQPMSWLRRFDEYRVSNTLVDYLVETGDPRLPLYVDPARNDGQYRGLRNGLNPSEIGTINVDEYSKDSDIIANQYAPTGILIYPEVLFLKAEAALKNWSGAGSDPAVYYEEGIRSSINYWLWIYEDIKTRLPEAQANALKPIEITQSEIDDFLLTDGIEYDPSKALEQIITQKWLALINQGFEAWAEYRRTGYPQLNAIPNSDNASETGVEVPSRVIYPAQESVAYNTENYQEAIERQGPDLPGTKVWWDIE